MEGFEEVLFAFSITFLSGTKGSRKKYVFGCFTQEQAVKWVHHLRRARWVSRLQEVIE
jgi:hypothetical protein